MKICITGASGFVGGNIARFLLNNSYEVVSIGRTNPCIKGIIHYETKLIEIDPSLIEKLPPCDVIVHCSFILASGNNLEDFKVLHDNIKLTESIVKLTKKIKAKSFVNLSSIAVYPNEDGVYSEESILDTSRNNDCLYGLSKICAENIFSRFLEKRSHIPVTHLRVAQVYGEGMKTDRTYHIMKDELEKENFITVWSNGERVSNFVNVTKVTKVVKYFIENAQFSGIYNLGGDNFSYAELAANIIKNFGNKESKIKFIDKGVKSKFYLDASKLDKLMGNNNLE